MTNKKLLDEAIARSGLKIGYICEQLGLTRSGFSKKRRNESAFTAKEVRILCKLLGISKAADMVRIFLNE